MRRKRLLPDAVGGIRKQVLDRIGVAEVRRPDALVPVLVSTSEPWHWWNLAKLALHRSDKALHDLISERRGRAGRVEAEHAQRLTGAGLFELFETNEIRSQRHHLRRFVPRRVVAARDAAQLLLGPDDCSAGNLE